MPRWLIHRSAWRNCLENSLKRLSAPLWRQEAPELGLLPPLLAALGAPIRDLSRISKQFRKVNSANFAFWGFCEVELPLYGVLRSSGAFLMLWSTYCAGAHTFPSARDMLRSLRGQLTPREGVGQLPTLLLD